MWIRIKVNADPDADPDPAKFLMRIRIPDPGPNKFPKSSDPTNFSRLFYIFMLKIHKILLYAVEKVVTDPKLEWKGTNIRFFWPPTLVFFRHFCLLDPDPDPRGRFYCGSMRIRTHWYTV